MAGCFDNASLTAILGMSLANLLHAAVFVNEAITDLLVGDGDITLFFPVGLQTAVTEFRSCAIEAACCRKSSISKKSESPTDARGVVFPNSSISVKVCGFGIISS